MVVGEVDRGAAGGRVAVDSRRSTAPAPPPTTASTGQVPLTVDPFRVNGGDYDLPRPAPRAPPGHPAASDPTGPAWATWRSRPAHTAHHVGHGAVVDQLPGGI